MKKIILVVVLISIAGGGGWYYLTRVHVTPIGEIMNDPRTFSGRDIAVSGTVTDRFSFFVIRYFTLSDSSGEIVVVTDRPLPSVGTVVRVKGHVEEGFSLGEQQVLVFVEKTP